MEPTMNPERDPLFRAIVIGMLAIVTVALVFNLVFNGVTHQTAQAAAAVRSTAATAATTSTYQPVTRDFVVAAVPLLVHEQSGTFDYLNKDFGPSGVLNGKELWGFSPSSFTVYQGDTVHVTVVNAGDDAHTFTVAAVGFNLSVDPQSTASGSFVVPQAGPFTFFCSILEHSPYMWGQLVVLPDSAAP
jgi:plastocyanin